MSRKNRHEHHDEHPDESWLIPYADILTLLLALFIVLFASAQIDQKKFDILAKSFSDAFGSGKTSIFQSVRTPPQVAQDNPTSKNSFSEKIPPPVNLTEDMQFQKEMSQLTEVKRLMDQYIKDNNLTGSLETALIEEGLMIRIKDTALFPSGSAELIPQSQSLGVQIAKLLASLTQNVVIAGHTDNVPINTLMYPTNWDLSSKRALNFMKFIISKDASLKPERFSAVGYGEYRPIAPNQTEAGRSINRRVEILIIRNYQ